MSDPGWNVFSVNVKPHVVTILRFLDFDAVQSIDFPHASLQRSISVYVESYHAVFIHVQVFFDVSCLSSGTEGEPAGGDRGAGQSEESAGPGLVLQQDRQHVGPAESPAAVLPQPGEQPGTDQELPFRGVFWCLDAIRSKARKRSGAASPNLSPVVLQIMWLHCRLVSTGQTYHF